MLFAACGGQLSVGQEEGDEAVVMQRDPRRVRKMKTFMMVVICGPVDERQTKSGLSSMAVLGMQSADNRWPARILGNIYRRIGSLMLSSAFDEDRLER